MLLAKKHHRRWWGWFRPNHLSGLTVWYDATRQAEADGAAVDTLIDYSGNGLSMTQGGAQRALMQRNVQAGKAAFEFDGIQDYYNGGNLFNMGTNGMLLYVAVNPTRTAIGDHFLFPIHHGIPGADIASRGGNFALSWFKSGGAEGLDFGVIDDTPPPADIVSLATTNEAWDTWQTVGVFCMQNEVVALFREGVLLATSGGDTFAPGTYTNTEEVQVGRGNQPAFYWYYLGYIGEISVHLRSATTTQERQKMESYFSHRWATNAGMSSSHPYYHYPP